MLSQQLKTLFFSATIALSQCNGRKMENFVLQYSNMKVVRFNLKKGDEVPLHLHDGQNGFAYLLEGRCVLTNYHIDHEDDNSAELTYHSEQEVEANGYCALTPKLNAHKILALEDCIFLDCFAPSIAEDCRCAFLEIVETDGLKVKARKLERDEVQLPDYWYANNTEIQAIS